MDKWKIEMNKQKLYAKRLWIKAKIEDCKDAHDDEARRAFERHLIRYDRLALTLEWHERQQETKRRLRHV